MRAGPEHEAADQPGVDLACRAEPPPGDLLDPVQQLPRVVLGELDRGGELDVEDALFRGNERIRSFPTVRQPNSVAVDTLTGRVFVAGRYRELQVIDPPLDTPE